MPIKESKTIKDIRKENVNNDKILRDIRNLFEPEENYYESIRIGNDFSSNCIEYESNRDKDKILTIEEYLDKIRPYLSGIINDHKTQGEWKTQLTKAINFFCLRDSKEARTMHSKSDNIKIMIGSKTDEIIDELFESLLKKYQKDLEESMKGGDFVVDTVDLLYYKLGLHNGIGKQYLNAYIQ